MNEKRNNLSTFHILFIHPNTIESNNGYQVQLLAKSLCKLGVKCTIAVPDNIDILPYMKAEFNVINYSSLLASAPGPYSLIHAWTPREIVREVCETYLKKHPIPYIVHLEDNEEYLTSITLEKSWHELLNLTIEELDRLIPPHLYHPFRGRKFLEGASGFTLVVDSLNKFNTKGSPYIILPPMVDDSLFYPRPINYELRKKLGISEKTLVLCYTGSVIKANYKDVFILYKTVEILNAIGYPSVLLRTGLDEIGLTNDWPKKYVINLGLVKRQDIPEIMAAADILVQLGEDNEFNYYRFPSKLVEYFAIRRPIIVSKVFMRPEINNCFFIHILDQTNIESLLNAIHKIRKSKLYSECYKCAMIDYSNIIYNYNLLIYKVTGRRILYETY